MRTRTLNASAYYRRRATYGMQEGEKLKFEIDWSAVLDLSGSSISTSAWTTDQSGLVTLSSDSTSGTKSLITVEAINEGVAILRNTTTFADGQKEIRIFRLEINETDDRGDQ